MTKEVCALLKNDTVGGLDASGAATRQELESGLYDDVQVLHDTPVTGGVRQAVDDTVSADYTPLSVMRKLKSARSGDTREFVHLCDNLLERDTNYIAARNAIVEAINEGRIVVEAGDTSRRSAKIAEQVRQMLTSAPVSNFIAHLASYKDYGFAAGKVVWDTSNPALWTVAAIEPIPHRHIVFDRKTGRIPHLMGSKPGDAPTPLKLAEHVYMDIPGAGLPVLRADGWVGVQIHAFKSLTLRDWVKLVEVYGQPLRLGYYDAKAASPKELQERVKKLVKALQNVGSDAWAALAKDEMQIEFIESANKSASGDIFQSLVRYLDEKQTIQIAGSVLATGTGNTGSGGSEALGSVHNQALMRKVKAQSRDIIGCLMSHIVKPFVEFNHGTNATLPIITMVWDEPEDIQGIATALEKLVPLGLEVSQEEVRAKLGFRAPEEGERTLARVEQADPAPAFSAFSSQADEIDRLIAEYSQDYQAADEVSAEQLLSQVEKAQTFEDLKAVLVRFVKTADLQDQQVAFTEMLTATTAAGEFGADLGGK